MSIKFRIVDKWNAYLNKIPEEKRDIYYIEEYTKLYENGDDTAMCIVGEDDDRIILMPFLRRHIGDYYDFETVYGYGGPITNSDENAWINYALAGMQSFFKDNSYICGFIRFHPLLQNASICKDSFNVIFDRKTIAINMEQPCSEIWEKQITSKNRNMIRKAEKSGLTYRTEYDFASMHEFVRLYNETMHRLDADDFYFFPDRYYEEFVEKMEGNGFLGIVLLEGQIVGAALFMYTGKYGHYHLAGSDRGKGSLGINNYLIWKTIEELDRKKIQEFHLGGGTSSRPDDSLYKFKKSFSSYEHDFYIGKWIFNEGIYKDVCNQWEADHPLIKDKYKNILLKYRYIR